MRVRVGVDEHRGGGVVVEGIGGDGAAVDGPCALGRLSLRLCLGEIVGRRRVGAADDLEVGTRMDIHHVMRRLRVRAGERETRRGKLFRQPSTLYSHIDDSWDVADAS